MKVGLLLVPQQGVEERVHEVGVGDGLLVGLEDGLDEESDLVLPPLRHLADLLSPPRKTVFAQTEKMIKMLQKVQKCGHMFRSE